VRNIPETCAQEIIHGVVWGKSEVLVGAIEKYSVLIKRFFPGLLRMAITKHPMQKLRKFGLLPRAGNITDFAMS
jgi:hypothetical protein